MHNKLNEIMIILDYPPCLRNTVVQSVKVFAFLQNRNVGEAPFVKSWIPQCINDEQLLRYTCWCFLLPTLTTAIIIIIIIRSLIKFYADECPY